MMALPHCFCATKTVAFNRVYLTQSSGDRKESLQEKAPRLEQSPAEDFAPLASVFRRRLLTGVGSASLVAVGANFAGITSFLLGFSPETGRNLKLDVLYPVGGYSRCLETNEGFEFIYPANWVGDQTLLYRAAGKAESERSLDPPPIGARRRQNSSEPVVAFGPPGSNGELNVSVIVSPVPLDFSIEAFGGPKEVGEAVIRTIIAGSRRGPEVKARMIESSMREDPVRNQTLRSQVCDIAIRNHNRQYICGKIEHPAGMNTASPKRPNISLKEKFLNAVRTHSLIAI
ncbi:hypothetical protein HHK36_026467 [Tetracentron sinense]|uniref:PsbP C-terminal domain-containing protein n=1 Tax=Tetracentron sinense TaxID=13715 RepID=A0A834YF35_TETSI|nr:hypothetical protein HHK36_026467 [Tetracentron sinense]